MPPEGSADGAFAHRFPCENCGADLRFDPEGGQLICDHCGHVEPLAPPPVPQATAIREVDFMSALRAGPNLSEEVDMRLAHCDNCGAEVEFEGAEHASECPYCASPLVIDTGAARRIKPQAVVPFKIDEQTARKAMADWLGRLWFAPDGLREYARKGRRMQGVYAPFWTFDADTKSRYTGARGTVYYVTRTVVQNGKRVQQRVAKVRWHPVSGRVARWFDDVLVAAATSLPPKYTEALAPWDLAALEPYQSEFLSGFRAEGYTVPLEAGFADARQKMDAVIRRDIRFDIGGDRQLIHQVDTDVSDVTFKHVLLPIWTAAYRFRGKSYRFVVNGQTGRVQGERPWSWIKITLAVILLAIVAGAVGYGLSLVENGGP